ncbi:velvet factor-domain-containing protein [Xylaria bambusicola]|uniref:velvet factor-domain-containing protein n=1 Tax=Xylaria bambusicola TaxID=326684 RepID=UPI002008B940|nr:velvet factor-domain-containing protein [Xylaria bambusicola]KAI0518026.1 velvet factor-domain-containing protein [Xylaria bambusicola]
MAYQQSPWAHIPHYVPMMNSGMPSLPTAQTQGNPPEQPGKQLEKYTLSFMQQPLHAKAANGKDKDRRPVDPPPILKLEVATDQDPDGVYKQSPYLIVVAYLEYGPGQDHGPDAMPPANLMSGTMVSSLHRLKDPGDQEGAFFVFGDLTIRREGNYCLRFDLLQMEFGVSSDPDSLVTVTSVTSNPFRVYSQKNFPKQQKNESTFLTRSFSDQGVRLRVRKDSRLSLNRKRTSDKAIEKYDRKRMAIESPGQGRRPSVQHRSSLDSTDQYHEGDMFLNEPASKRHRTGSGALSTTENGLETRSWGSYQPGSSSSFASHGSMTSIGTGPPTSASLGAPQMPPPTTRLDTHFSSLHTGSSMFHSPVGERQSPVTPSSVHQSPFNSTGSQNSSMAYLYGTSLGQNGGAQALNLAPVGAHTQSAMSTPRLADSSPRPHAHPTNATSPMGVNIYAPTSQVSAPPQPRQLSYNTPTYHHGLSSAFDHSTLHEHGMNTPLTANMPPDSLKGGYADVFNGVTAKSE